MKVKKAKQVKATVTDTDEGTWSKPISMRADAELLAQLEEIARIQRRKLGSLIKIMVEDQLPIERARLGLDKKK